MSALEDLIKQVDDEKLRNRLFEEAKKATKHKKFGLVFEDHLPECTPLYDIPVSKGSFVAKKQDKEIKNIYRVERIIVERENAFAEPSAICVRRSDKEEALIPVSDLVCIAEFGDPIYPYLKPIDSICNNPDSNLWHTLIEADNFHALQLLEYLYAGKVDCIYIDPPYNTGATDWKYNNDYVDKNDSYRHSKWLSFMKKRLKLAKKLLAKNGVLICAIDQHEFANLALLFEDIFPRYLVESDNRDGKYFHDYVSVVHNPRGQQNDNISYVHETLIYIYPSRQGKFICDVAKSSTDNRGLRDSGTSSDRTDARNCFYPFIVQNGKIISIGDVPDASFHPETSNVLRSDGCIEIWPIDTSGKEKKWRYSRNKVDSILNDLFIKDVKGIYSVIYGKKLETMPTVWQDSKYDASEYGTKILKKIFCEETKDDQRFSYAKSLYAVNYAVRSVVSNRPNALVLDFFAGSGTTLHAVNLLNSEDNGRRRCILVTNNEMTGDEATKLKKLGILPGTEDYNAHGIARYVTWPRTVCSIKGENINKQPLLGEYLTSLTEEQESERKFTQLSFVSDLAPLNKNQKKQIIKLINSGRDKQNEQLTQNLVGDDCSYIVSEERNLSVLFEDSHLDDYLVALEGQEHIKEFFIVSSSNALFKNAKDQINELLGPYKENVPITRPMKDGFKANAVFFQLSFLNKNSVELGRCFKEMIPILWMKTGCKNKCPILETDKIPDWLILPENEFAVLVNESAYTAFIEEISKTYQKITAIFLVTDSEDRFSNRKNDLKSRFAIKNIIQLYHDYLDNFKINIHREA